MLIQKQTKNLAYRNKNFTVNLNSKLCTTNDSDDKR